MKYGINENGDRVHIVKADDNDTYRCPFCNDILVLKKGKIRNWHFAHKNGECSESFPKPHVSLQLNTIPNLWNAVKPAVMIVQSNTSERKFRIHDDPNVSIYKYGRCYGYMSDSNGKFSTKSKSIEIYGFDEINWILLWYKKRKEEK